jgi:hypothetical protein
MRILRITLFMIAFVILTSQTFRHAYVRWLEPRGSVLDKYETHTEQQITMAKSLDELVTLFDSAHTKVLEYEKANPPKVDTEPRRYPGDAEPYKTESSLRDAIKDWEQKSKEIHELWHFWIAGVLAFVIGSFLTLKSDRWSGMALLILAFAEMIWSTSPTFRSIGAQPEFDRLLVHKFVLSVISLILLLATWFISQQITDPRKAQ